MTPITFRVYGVPLPKGNLKAYTPRGMKFPIVTESNRSVKSWQQLIAEGANRALHDRPEGDRVLFAYAVRVSVAFYLPRPKKFAKRGVFVPHCTAPDVDKLARAVLDALGAVVYHDDKQVTELITAKYYAPVDAPPYAEIRVEAAPGAPLDRLALPLFEATG